MEAQRSEHSLHRRRRRRRRSAWSRFRHALRRQWRFGCIYSALLLALLAFALLRPPDAPQPLSDSQREASLERVAAFRETLERAREAGRSGRETRFEARLTEDDMNTFLRDDPEAIETLSREGIEEAWVRVGSGRLVATAVRRVSGLPLSMTAGLRPGVSATGGVRFLIEEVHVGRVGVDVEAARRLAERFARTLEQKLFDTRIRYRAVELRDRALILTGETVRSSSP